MNWRKWTKLVSVLMILSTPAWGDSCKKWSTAYIGGYPIQYCASYIYSGSSLPANCVVGDSYFKTAATIGWYSCNATDTWAYLSTGGGIPGLTSAHIFVGNSSNVATDVAASSDVSLANTGAFTIIGINGTNLAGLATGILKNTTATGVPSIATVSDISGPAFCADAGSTDAYACNLSPAITSYVTGTHYRFKANTVNTGAATIQFNGITGPKTIKKALGGITTDLADNDIRAGQWVDLVFDGTNMQMQSSLGAVPDLSGTYLGLHATADTATALAADPTGCTNQFTRDINASGTATCASVAGTDFAVQNANKVLAGPTTGVDATPTYRSLVAGDIPSLSGVYQPLDAALTALASGSDFLKFAGPATSVKTWTGPDADATLITSLDRPVVSCNPSGASSTVYTCASEPNAQTAYIVGRLINFKPDVASGAADVTLTIDGLGTALVLYRTDGTTKITTDDLHASRTYIVQVASTTKALVYDAALREGDIPNVIARQNGISGPTGSLFPIILASSPGEVTQDSTPNYTVNGDSDTFPNFRIADPTGALGSESLSEGNFATHTKWSVTGDFAFSSEQAVYTHSTGVGALIQASGDMAHAGVGLRVYKFVYTVVSNTGVSACGIASSFTGDNPSLDLTSGVGKVLYFLSLSSPGDFEIDCTSSSGVLTLDDFSLKELQAGDLSVGGIVAAHQFTGPLTGNVTGNASGSAASFTGSLAGDVSGIQGKTVVDTVGGSSAANVHAAEVLANAATSANTASAIVRRDASGNFGGGTRIQSLVLFDPLVADSGRLQFMLGQASTIIRVACSTKLATSTVTINLDQRAAATPDTPGTNVLSADLVCDTNQQTSCASGCDVNTISGGSIAVRVPVALTISGVANAPTDVRVFVEYTVN